MSNTYKITIKNLSNSPQQFLLFADTPTPRNISSSQVFTNVYQRSPKIESGEDSRVEFHVTSQFFAVLGAKSQNATGGVKVATSSSVPVRLGPGGSVVGLTYNNGRFAFDNASTRGRMTEAEGAFSIVTDNSFRYSDGGNTYIGMGALDPQGRGAVPVQTYVAEPGSNSLIFPSRTYLISTGDHEPGSIVDRNSLGNCLKVDFSRADFPEAVFTLGANGEYTEDKQRNRRGW